MWVKTDPRYLGMSTGRRLLVYVLDVFVSITEFLKFIIIIIIIIIFIFL